MLTALRCFPAMYRMCIALPGDMREVIRSTGQLC